MIYNLIWCCLLMSGAPERVVLHTIDTWRHDFFFGGQRFATLVDPHGALLGQFQKDSAFLMTKDALGMIRPDGQGPDDIDNTAGLFIDEKGRLVVVQLNGRIKVFTWQGEKSYRREASIYAKPTGAGVFFDDIAAFEGRLFLAGFGMTRGENGEFAVVRVRALDKDGSSPRNIVVSPMDAASSLTESPFVENHLKGEGSMLYAMNEKSMTLWVIDGRAASLERELELEVPPFYVPIGDDFFRQVDSRGKPWGSGRHSLKLAEWRTSYSRVENLEVLGGYLVVQIRIARANRPLFALLFYDRGDFDLIGMAETDGLLVGARDDQLYLLRGGHPGFDDEAGECIVDIVTPELPR